VDVVDAEDTVEDNLSSSVAQNDEPVHDAADDDAERASVGAEGDGAERPDADDGLLSRLRVIEDQPLESRAAAYAHLHDELRERLEGGDVPPSHG
jgi:hypothetical protein